MRKSSWRKRALPKRRNSEHHSWMLIFTLIRRLRDWLTLVDYDAAKDRATEDVLCSFGLPRAMDRADLNRLSARGDVAMAALARLLPRGAAS